MISPTSPLLPLYLSQTVWGLLYAIFIHWMSVNHYGKGGTAFSVAVGVGVTLFIQWLYLPVAHTSVTFGSFACSGFWMTISYMYRYEKRKKSHKARRLPNRAMKLKDDVCIDLNMIAEKLSARDENASEVHELHLAIRTLMSM